MTQDELERLHRLEESVEKLKEARVRASEQLKQLRKQRDKHTLELKKAGIDPNKAKEHLKALADSIDVELSAIEDQIPPDLEELLASEEHNGDRK